MAKGKTRKYLKVTWKVVRTIFLILAGLFLILVIALQLPFIRDKIVDVALNKMRKKLDTRIELADLNILLPNSVHLEGLYIEDQSNDTLLYAGELDVRVGLPELVSGNIDISHFSLEETTAKIKRPEEDSLFNFNFIIEAFSKPGKEPKKEKKKGQKGSFSIGKIELDDIRFLFDDNYTGNYVNARIGDFITVFSEFDPGEMLFDIKRIGLNNSWAALELSPSEDTSSSGPPPEIILQRTARFKNVSVNLQVPGTDLDIDQANLKISPDEVNLGENKIYLDRILLSQTDILYRKTALPAGKKPPPGNTAAGKEFPYDIQISAFDMHSNYIRYMDVSGDNPDTSSIAKNLRLQDVFADINDIVVNKNRYHAEIREFNFYEEDGLRIEQIAADITINDTMANLDNFRLITNNSSVYISTEAHYASMEMISENPGDIRFTSDITESSINTDDIAYFAPELAGKLEKTAGNDRIYLFSAHMDGRVEDMDIQNLELRNNHDMILSMKGGIKGLPEAKSAYYDLRFDTITVRKYHIYTFVPDTAIPSTIDVPREIYLSGNFKGSFDDFSTGFLLHTSQGSMNADLQFASGGKSGRERYSGDINIDSYDIGALLKNEQMLGELKLEGEFQGSSRDFKNIDAGFDFRIDKVVAKQYAYNNINIRGQFDDQLFEGQINVNDSNLIADFDGRASLGDSVPEYDFTLFVEGIDLMALNLSQQNIRLRGTLVSDFEGNSLDEINGELRAKDLIIIKNEETFRVDSIVAEAQNAEGSSSIELISPFLDATYEGTVAFNEIGPLLKENFKHYFNLKEEGMHEHTAEGNFNFEMEIKDSEILTQLLLPGMENFIPASIEAEYDWPAHSFDLTALFPRINYNGIILDTLRLETDSDEEELNFNIGFNHLQSSPFETGKTAISGSAGGDSIIWHFTNRDVGKEDSLLYSVKGIVRSRQDAYFLSLLNDTLRLNASTFNIPENNTVELGGTVPRFRNFILTSGDQRLALTNPDTSGSQPAKIVIDFRRFHISNLTALIEAGQNIFEGYLGGRLALDAGKDGGTFNSNLTINNLSLFGEEVFRTIQLDADNRAENRMVLRGDFSGKKSSMQLNGTLTSGEEQTGIDAEMNIRMLDLSILEPFFPDQINQLEGRLSGELQVSNNISDPRLNGSLHFNSVVLNPSFLNIPLTIPDEEISFEGRTINFDDFNIEDPSGAIASLNGSIDAENFARPDLNLDFDADDFQLMDTEAGQDRMFYGDVTAGVNARIRGTTLNPDISLDISLDNESEIYFIVPEAGSATIEREGIVVFFDREGDSLSNILTREETVDTAANREFSNLRLNANIDIDESVLLTIIVDPATNEQLESRGNGNLSFGMNTSGQMSLAGRYEVVEGEYNLRLFEVIKRNFIIREGSTLTWTGDVANPQLDLTTYYRVKTSPDPIIVTQTTGEGASFQNMNFNVVMNIEGELLQPELNFEITMPPAEREAVIATRLNRLNQNENELNKQVFSLLLFNSFLQESTSSDNSLAYELRSTARKGVGNLLSQQINRFSDKYIEGFDINVDIDSYSAEETGEVGGRTNVQADVSKQLFDERLTVSVGGSANIQEGSRRTDNAESLSNIAGDVEVMYKLTEDGTYRLVGFRKTEYEDILDGELRKTGIGVIFNKDFFSFRNLFKRKNKGKAEEE